jgi:hypothetical protein
MDDHELEVLYEWLYLGLLYHFTNISSSPQVVGTGGCWDYPIQNIKRIQAAPDNFTPVHLTGALADAPQFRSKLGHLSNPRALTFLA